MDCVSSLLKSRKVLEATVLFDAIEIIMVKPADRHLKPREVVSLVKSQIF